jgi:hypothetical protein
VRAGCRVFVGPGQRLIPAQLQRWNRGLAFISTSSVHRIPNVGPFIQQHGDRVSEVYVYDCPASTDPDHKLYVLTTFDSPDQAIPGPIPSQVLRCHLVLGHSLARSLYDYCASDGEHAYTAGDCGDIAPATRLAQHARNVCQAARDVF